MDKITTTDLADFGQAELKQLEALLKAKREQGFPKDFNNDEVVPMFNMNSGYVFLTNADYQVAMLTDDGKLESFYSCPECGHEGFLADMKHTGSKECKQYVKDIKEAL